MSGVLASLVGGQVPVIGPLNVSVNVSSLSGFSYGLSSPITDSPANLTIIGGNSPYTVDWERVSGSTDIYATSDDGLTTYFTTTTAVGVVSAVWRAKVTDDSATVAYSSNISITLEAFDYPSNVYLP